MPHPIWYIIETSPNALVQPGSTVQINKRWSQHKSDISRLVGKYCNFCEHWNWKRHHRDNAADFSGVEIYFLDQVTDLHTLGRQKTCGRWTWVVWADLTQCRVVIRRTTQQPKPGGLDRWVGFVLNAHIFFYLGPKSSYVVIMTMLYLVLKKVINRNIDWK